MSAPQLITAYGATGSRGGSVVASLLQNKTSNFVFRGTTRNPDSAKAAELKAQGMEVVKTDGFFKAQAVEAFKGSWAVFLNTNSDDPALDAEGAPTETALGKDLVDAAAEAGVKHIVYSGLASATLASGGRKYAISEYAKSNATFRTVTIVQPGWYLENHLLEEMTPFCGGFPFQEDADGFLTLRFPRWDGTDEIPFISISDDFGDVVHGVLLAPQKYHGKSVQAISVSAKPEELVATFEKVTGKKSRFIPIDEWKSMETYGTKVYNTIREMFGFCQISGGLYYGVPNDITDAKELKVAAAQAKGTGGANAGLASLHAFITQHFGDK